MAFKYYEGQRVRIKKETLRPLFSNGFESRISFRYQSPVSGYCYRLDGYGMWFHEDELEPVCTEKIVIMSDGVTTTAKRYDGKKVVKEAKTVCSKDDTFDFEVGAKLAMERLITEDKPKLYNGKVVCVDPNGFSCYTKGKIYEVKDGLYFNDGGIPFPCCYRLHSFDDLQRDSAATWLEVIE